MSETDDGEYLVHKMILIGPTLQKRRGRPLGSYKTDNIKMDRDYFNRYYHEKRKEKLQALDKHKCLNCGKSVVATGIKQHELSMHCRMKFIMKYWEEEEKEKEALRKRRDKELQELRDVDKSK
jgi:regulator of protease activity HflC (stomatin/prohibitin superfamily)